MDNELKKALHRKALGYEAEERTEEYDEQKNITKSKVTYKHFAPDVQAVRMLLEDVDKDDEFDFLTMEEIEKKRERIIKQYLEER